MKIFLVILLELILNSAFGQVQNSEWNKQHSNTIQLGFKQIKENANYGLVFNGPQIAYVHYWESSKNNRVLSIENELGICIPFSKDIPALDIYFKPVEASYLWRTAEKSNFGVGPLLKFEYNYTLYPQLQSAFDYWFTNFSFGINTFYNFNLGNQSLSARLKFSLCGFISRQSDDRSPYFYDLGFNHAINHLHSNLKFSAIDDYNTSDFELYWNRNSNSRISWAYGFKYVGYFEAPQITYITHYIKIVFHPKIDNE